MSARRVSQAGALRLVSFPPPAVADATAGVILAACIGTPASVVGALEAVPDEMRADVLAHLGEWAACGVARETPGYGVRDRLRLRRIDGQDAVMAFRRGIRSLRRTGGRS